MTQEPVAQGIEHQPSKLGVAGSTPAGLTTHARSVLERYFADGVHGTDEYNMRRLLHELHEAGLVIVPAQTG